MLFEVYFIKYSPKGHLNFNTSTAVIFVEMDSNIYCSSFTTPIKRCFLHRAALGWAAKGHVVASGMLRVYKI